jgi:hypothetical protein
VPPTIRASGNLTKKKFRHNVAERFIPWVQTPSVARGVKAMKHKRLKTRRIAEQQLTVVIFCRNPLATSLIKQVLPPEFFIVKEPPITFGRLTTCF